MATNEIWQLSVKGTVHGTQHIHTLHFIEVAGPLLGSDLLTAYGGAPLTAYRACFAAAAAPVQQIEARKVCGTVPLDAPMVTVPTTANSLGTRTDQSGQMENAYEACLVTLKGTKQGRRYSGRFFLGGLYQSDTSNNLVYTPYTTKVTAYCSALSAAFMPPAGLAFRLFNFSSLLAKGDPLHTKRSPDGSKTRIPDPVTAVQCQLAGSFVSQLVVSGYATTMRSRKLGHGN